MLQDCIDQLIDISRTYRTIAGDLLDEAFEQYRAGTMSEADYRRYYKKCYLPAVRHAVDMLIDETYRHSAQLDQHLGAIATATSDLKAALELVDKVDAVVEFGAKLVGAAAKIVALVAAPNPGTALAAAQALADLLADLPS